MFCRGAAWRCRWAALLALAVLSAACGRVHAAASLSLWNDGAAKQAIERFVGDVTREGGPRYVPPPQRVAVFDNDGTLWCEQPLYVQGAFINDRVRALAATDPALRKVPAIGAVLDGDPKALAATGEQGIADLVMRTHAGMTTDEFRGLVVEWVLRARHPRFARPYTELAYAPMVQLLEFLRGHGFSTYIVSGGGVDFMRPWTERVYGIPPEQVIGSTIRTKFALRGVMPVLERLPEIDLVDDRGGKPVGIDRHIGRRPILAFGNSDGDLEMLQYTDVGDGPRLMLLLHHDDASREYAYDRTSHVGRLDKAWDEAAGRGWTVVSMKNDFAAVFPATGRD